MAFGGKNTRESQPDKQHSYADLMAVEWTSLDKREGEITLRQVFDSEMRDLRKECTDRCRPYPYDGKMGNYLYWLLAEAVFMGDIKKSCQPILVLVNIPVIQLLEALNETVREKHHRGDLTKLDEINAQHQILVLSKRVNGGDNLKKLAQILQNIREFVRQQRAEDALIIAGGSMVNEDRVAITKKRQAMEKLYQELYNELHIKLKKRSEYCRLDQESKYRDLKRRLKELEIRGGK